MYLEIIQIILFIDKYMTYFLKIINIILKLERVFYCNTFLLFTN